MENNRKIKTCKGECHEKQNRKTIAEFFNGGITSAL